MYSKVFPIRCSTPMVQRFDKMCKSIGTNRSQLVRELMLESVVCWELGQGIVRHRQEDKRPIQRNVEPVRASVDREFDSWEKVDEWKM